MPTNRVLYVEDHEDIIRMVSRAIRRLGLEIVVARTGAEAQAQLSQGWDILICDIFVPGMNGIDYVRVFRGQHPHTPILMLTGSGADGEEAACRAAGCNEFLLKPVPQQEIEAIVRRYLRLDAP